MNTLRRLKLVVCFFLPFIYEPSDLSLIHNKWMDGWLFLSFYFVHLVPELVADGACPSAVDDVIHEMTAHAANQKCLNCTDCENKSASSWFINIYMFLHRFSSSIKRGKSLFWFELCSSFIVKAWQPVIRQSWHLLDLLCNVQPVAMSTSTLEVLQDFWATAFSKCGQDITAYEVSPKEDPF